MSYIKRVDAFQRIIRKRCVDTLEYIKERVEKYDVESDKTMENIFRRVLGCGDGKGFNCRIQSLCPRCLGYWKYKGSHTLQNVLSNTRNPQVWVRVQSILWPRFVGRTNDGNLVLANFDTLQYPNITWLNGSPAGDLSTAVTFDDMEGVLQYYDFVGEMIRTRTAFNRLLRKCKAIGTMSRIYIGPVNTKHSGVIFTELVVGDSKFRAPENSIYWKSCDEYLREYWDMTDEGVRTNWYLTKDEEYFEPEYEPPTCKMLYDKLHIPWPHERYEDSVGREYTYNRQKGYCIPLLHKFTLEQMPIDDPFRLVDRVFWDYTKVLSTAPVQEILKYQMYTLGRRDITNTGCLK